MNAGMKIIRSCELVESVWVQVQDMTHALNSMIDTALKKNHFDTLQPVGKSHTTYGYTRSRWSSTDSATSFPVQEKRRRRTKAPDAWINYQVSVFGTGIPPLAGDDDNSIGPVVHVSYWQLATNMNEEGTGMGFPLEQGDWDIADQRLIVWNSSDEGKPLHWTFTIRLLDLNSEDALRSSILEPLRMLIAGDPPALALPDNVPGLVFYHREETGESQKRVVAAERAMAH